MKMFRTWMLSFVLLSVTAVTTQNCAWFKPPPSLTTQAGQDAFVANQVVTILGDMRDGVFAANSQEWLSDHVTSIINKSVQASLDALDAAPSGAKAIGINALDGIQNQLNPEELTRAKPYLDSGRILLGGL